MAISGDTIEDVIKPEMVDQYHEEKHLWFPRSDTKEHAAYDRRKPGLFHLEVDDGISMISLCSKTYYVERECNIDKFSSKGLQKRGNQITKDTFLEVLKTKTSGSGVNTGFRLKNNSVHTYVQQKCALSYFYPKRKVSDDGVSTLPLDI